MVFPVDAAPPPRETGLKSGEGAASTAGYTAIMRTAVIMLASIMLCGIIV